MTDKTLSDLEAPGRIPDLHETERRGRYWIDAAKDEDITKEDALIALHQAVLAWRNAAYAMADQRDAARSQTADLEALMADGAALLIIPPIESKEHWRITVNPFSALKATAYDAPTLAEAISRAKGDRHGQK